MVINLWSGPRNISTTMMYCFAQHSLIKVVDEPFYANYLMRTQLQHPGYEEVLRTQPINELEIYRQLSEVAATTPHLFIKQMTHHIPETSYGWINEMKNVFLVRHPSLVIKSYAKVLHDVKPSGIGIFQQYDILKNLQARGQHYMIMDTEKILCDPATYIAKICHNVGLPFEKSMLQWERGAKPYDGSWAKYWYANVHNSTGFEKMGDYNYDVPEKFKHLLELCMPLYLELKQLET